MPAAVTDQMGIFSLHRPVAVADKRVPDTGARRGQPPGTRTITCGRHPTGGTMTPKSQPYAVVRLAVAATLLLGLGLAHARRPEPMRWSSALHRQGAARVEALPAASRSSSTPSPPPSKVTVSIFDPAGARIDDGDVRVEEAGVLSVGVLHRAEPRSGATTRSSTGSCRPTATWSRAASASTSTPTEAEAAPAPAPGDPAAAPPAAGGRPRRLPGAGGRRPRRGRALAAPGRPLDVAPSWRSVS